MKGIADTGFLVAFLNRHDQHHTWAVSLARSVDAPLLTCEAVLAEAAFHLGSVEHVLATIETGLVRNAFDFNAHLPALGRLAKRYADRRPDLADLCLICLSEAHPQLPVITVDRDFMVYRRHRREVIPVLMP